MWTITIVLVVAVLSVWILTNLVLAWYPTQPARHYPSRVTVTTTPADYGLPFQDIEIGKEIHGWLIPTNPSRPTVIFVHGWAGCREERWVPFLELAKEVYRRDMNAILFDMGYVQGLRPYTGGTAESKDVSKVVDWAHGRGNGPIVVWGFSAGGHATLLALREEPNRIDCAITDSAFISAFDSFASMYKQMLHIPKVSFMLVPLFFRLFSGYFPKRVRAVANKPLFVIHGTEDSSIPVSNGRWLAEWVQCEYWEVTDVNHEGAFLHHTDEYIRNCFSFIERCISS